MNRISGIFLSAGFCLVFWFSAQAWGDSSTAWSDSDTGQLSYGGRVGIGTANPGATLNVIGTVKLAPKVTLSLEGQPGPVPPNTLEVEGFTSLGPSLMRSYFPNRDDRKAYVSGSAGIILRTWPRGGARNALTIKRDGAVGIGTDTPEALLEAKGVADPLILVRHEGDLGNPAIHFKQGTEVLSYIWANRTNGDLNLGNPSINPLISLKKNGRFDVNGTTRTKAMEINGKLDVGGTTRTKVLEITGGGDLAEPFDVTRSERIKPGMVVVIDPEQPGRLRIADRAYDRTVAGCVSGAKGIHPGLTMRQEGTVVDGSLPVSLSGRVYCRVDASYGEVLPGDLLTTSETPGHAMKVTDYARAQGAVLGKAMTALKRGTGMVLILVALQ